MRRVPEPELMDTRAQAQAYAAADFEESNSLFIDLYARHFEDFAGDARVVDLGCGPGDIAIRFARRFPQCTVHGIDGAEEMLRPGRERLAGEPDLSRRVALLHGLIPGAALPHERYDAIISNSLLHHLHDPMVLWQTVREVAAPGAAVLVMDLQRPANTDAAAALVERYAAGEPDILREDFYNSLCAAFEPDEIRAQLEAAGLDTLTVDTVSDRHVAVAGRL